MIFRNGNLQSRINALINKSIGMHQHPNEKVVPVQVIDGIDGYYNDNFL